MKLPWRRHNGAHPRQSPRSDGQQEPAAKDIFLHIIARAIPVFYNVLTGGVSIGYCLAHFIVPVMLGNIVGGVALVAAAVHAEFISEEGASHHNHPSEKYYVPGHSRKNS